MDDCHLSNIKKLKKKKKQKTALHFTIFTAFHYILLYIFDASFWM